MRQARVFHVPRFLRALHSAALPRVRRSVPPQTNHSIRLSAKENRLKEFIFGKSSKELAYMMTRYGLHKHEWRWQVQREIALIVGKAQARAFLYGIVATVAAWY